jgi:hypothetical protein
LLDLHSKEGGYKLHLAHSNGKRVQATADTLMKNGKKMGQDTHRGWKGDIL